jgi:hypothetical protein
MTTGAAAETPTFTGSSRRTGVSILTPLGWVSDVIHLLTVSPR